jgi:hypothetical protein
MSTTSSIVAAPPLRRAPASTETPSSVRLATRRASTSVRAPRERPGRRVGLGEKERPLAVGLGCDQYRVRGMTV